MLAVQFASRQAADRRLLTFGPQTLDEIMWDETQSFEDGILCQGADCFKQHCDHLRDPHEFQQELNYLWQVKTFELKAAGNRPRN